MLFIIPLLIVFFATNGNKQGFWHKASKYTLIAILVLNGIGIFLALIGG